MTQNFYTRANCWPTSKQLLLLKAGLFEKEDAIKSWQQYCQGIDIQKIDRASIFLLPYVYKNLISDSLFPAQFNVCKSVYDYTWSQNQLAFFQFKKVATIFNSLNIPIILLKGAALILGYYKDFGVRNMGDIDILVLRAQAMQAMEQLQHLNWRPEQKITKEALNKSNEMTFFFNNNSVIDMHWGIFESSQLDTALSQHTYRTTAVDSDSLNMTVSLLGVEDQLIHVITHGLRYSPVSLIRWIPDATIILKQVSHFDWDYFFSQVKKLDLLYFIKEALCFLHEHQFANIPTHALRVLYDYAPQKHEIGYFKFMTQEIFDSWLFPFKLAWHHAMRNSKIKNKLFVLLTLPKFLKNYWRISYWHQFPLFLLKKIFIHFKRIESK